MFSFERLQLDAFRYGIFVDKDDNDNIFLIDLETYVLLVPEYGIPSIEAAYELFEEIIKDMPEPVMSIDYAERKFPEMVEYMERRANKSL